LSNPRLEIRNLSRRFAGQFAVDDVSLRLEPGQVTCLLGPSGCGKSTTLRIVAGVERQDSGEVLIDGALVCDGTRSQPPELRNIGMMFQDFALFPHLSVWENVAFGLKGAKSIRRARAEELLERVDLAGYGAQMPHELSGGEQQRVALARAVAPGPRIMLLDEPFSGLDDRLRDGIRDETLEVLREAGTAVLMVTHDPGGEAMKMADEIALMRDGKIVQKGAPYTIYNSPIDKDAASFFSDINVWWEKLKAPWPRRLSANSSRPVMQMARYWTSSSARNTFASILTVPAKAPARPMPWAMRRAPKCCGRVFWGRIHWSILSLSRARC